MNELAYLRIAERNRKVDEVRQDHTRQREFEKRFESRDLPNSRAAIADMTDGGRAAKSMGCRLDPKPKIDKDAIIRKAALRLPRKPPILQKLLWAIYRNGKNREKTIKELGIGTTTYYRVLNQLNDYFDPPK